MLDAAQQGDLEVTAIQIVNRSIVELLAENEAGSTGQEVRITLVDLEPRGSRVVGTLGEEVAQLQLRLDEPVVEPTAIINAAEREHVAHFNAGAEAPGAVVGLGLVQARVVKAFEYLFIATGLKHEIGIGTLVVHPRRIELSGVFLKRTRRISGTKPVLISVAVAERTTEQPGGFFIGVDETVNADIQAVDFLLEACGAAGLDGILLPKDRNPAAVLSAVTDFASTLAKILNISLIRLSLTAGGTDCAVVIHLRRERRRHGRRRRIRSGIGVRIRINDYFVITNQIPLPYTGSRSFSDKFSQPGGRVELFLLTVCDESQPPSRNHAASAVDVLTFLIKDTHIRIRTLTNQPVCAMELLRNKIPAINHEICCMSTQSLACNNELIG